MASSQGLYGVEVTCPQKKAKELSEQKEELDRLANLFSTTTPSKDEAIVAESTKSTPAVESFNAVNSLFQIKQVQISNVSSPRRKNPLG